MRNAPPRPLRDLAGLMRWVLLIILALNVLFAAFLVYAVIQTGSWEVLSALGTVVMGIGVMVVFFAVVPSRYPDVVFLRSFASDRGSRGLITTFRLALASEMRLAAINRPARRIPLVFKPVLLGLQAVRFLGAQNLEAGVDWRVRLCGTLMRGCAAIVDLRDETPAVLFEARAAGQILDSDDILLIVDEEISDARWSEIVGQDVKTPDQIEARDRTRRELAEDVSEWSEFISGVPIDADPPILQEALDETLPRSIAGRVFDAVQVVVGVALLLLIINRDLLMDLPEPVLWVVGPLLGLLTLWILGSIVFDLVRGFWFGCAIHRPTLAVYGRKVAIAAGAGGVVLAGMVMALMNAYTMVFGW